MSAYVYCIDNDILKKLATFELFEQTLKIFDSSYDEVKLLKTAEYKFKRDWEKSKKVSSKKKGNQVVNYEKVLELAKNLPHISEADIDQQAYEELLMFEKIDAGEAILTSHATAMLQKSKSVQLFTGDKNFLKALAQANLPIIQKSLEHRFWCLEQLILKNIMDAEFEAVRDNIVPVRECDQAIKAVFGSRDQSLQENVVNALVSYIEDLRSKTGNLLSLYPEMRRNLLA